jgi:polar amino acid transport system substrate-binding protein
VSARGGWFAASAAVLAVIVTACSGAGGATPAPSSEPSLDPATDKLAEVLARGTLVLSTDPAYPPQSFLVEGAERRADTKCASNQLTAPEVAGFDADTGKAVAEILGVEPCFVTPPWNQIIAGNWGDRWDIAWGSGAITEERMTRLYVTQPSYATPHNFFVPADSPVQDAGELSGKAVGACAGCTHELYLRHELVLPGPPLDYAVDDPEIVTFDAEPPGLEATADGELDAFLCGEPVGTEAIASGLALRMLPEPAYYTQKTGYLDRASSLDQAAFVARINEVMTGLHADGTLKALSLESFGVDYATAAAEFDLATVGQAVP